MGERRHIGDATRQRIDDLADGWRVPGAQSDSTRDLAAQSDSTADLDSDETLLQPPSVEPAPVLRPPAVLPRKRGLLGDVRYVFTVLFSGTEARRELGEVRKLLDSERAARIERVVALGREAVASTELEIDLVERARDRLAELADEESRCAGAAAATDAEIEVIERKRRERSQAHLDGIRSLEADLQTIAADLAPLERRVSTAKERGAELRAELGRLDKKIASAEATASDPAAQAELASLRAEREILAKEEPAIAAELDELEPKTAALIGARGEAEAQIDATRAREKEAAAGHRERIEAMRARRAVEARRVAEAARRRDQALLDLGEQLCLERPEALRRRLHPIEQHDISIATLERRALELGELVDGIDRSKLARGLGILVAAALLIGIALYAILAR